MYYDVPMRAWGRIFACVAGISGCVEAIEPVPPHPEGCVIDSPTEEFAVTLIRSRTETHDGNTVTAIVDADMRGYSHVEIDVVMSSDGELVPGLVRKQSTIVLYGHGHRGVGMEVLNQVQWAEPNMLSPVGASGGFDEDGRPTVYRRALRMIEEGAIDVAPLVTHRYAGLEAVPAAFAGGHRDAEYVKGVALLT